MLRVAAVTALTLLILAVPAAPARADDVVVCPPGGTVCYVVVETPGAPGATPSTRPANRSNPAKPICRTPGTGTIVPCFDEVFGWWSHPEGCYYQRLEPPPPSTDPVWAGHFPDGAVYQTTCLGVPGTGGGWVWRQTPPPGYGGAGVTAEQLAAQAIEQLDLTGPDIGLAPDPAKTGLVGLPVWMWTTVSPSTWGPTSATASVPGLSVTATAKAVRIVWDMGDGQSVACTGPGTPYARAAGATTSPTCGHLYQRSSADQPDEAYTVTATTTWDIQWIGGGGSGQLSQTRSSSTTARIGELQVLVS